jgi:hypothetical protein
MIHTTSEQNCWKEQKRKLIEKLSSLMVIEMVHDREKLDKLLEKLRLLLAATGKD